MKRPFFILVLFLVSLSFFSCTEPGAAISVPDHFRAAVTLPKTEATAECRVLAGGVCEIVFLTPDPLAGITLRKEADGTVFASFSGQSVSLSGADLWFLPFQIAQNGKILSRTVKKGGTDLRVSVFGTPCTVSLLPDGSLLSLTSDDVTFTVTEVLP